MSGWRALLDRFDRRSLRERVLIVAAALGLLATLWDAGVAGPQQRTQRTREQAVAALRTEVLALERSAQALAAQAGDDPALAAGQAAASLRAEVAELDRRLASATAGLIEPREMGRVLEQVLGRTARIRLLSLRTLTPEPMLAAQPAAGAAPPAPAATAQLWRHGVEIELAGGFLETLEFLQALEGLPWRFHWDRVDYGVEQYPLGRARLRLHTLGLGEGWIGV